MVMRKCRGVTLVEAMIAIMIVAVGTGAIYGMVEMTKASERQSDRAYQAANYTRGALEQVQRIPFDDARVASTIGITPDGFINPNIANPADPQSRPGTFDRVFDAAQPGDAIFADPAAVLEYRVQDVAEDFDGDGTAEPPYKLVTVRLRYQD